MWLLFILGVLDWAVISTKPEDVFAKQPELAGERHVCNFYRRMRR